MMAAVQDLSSDVGIVRACRELGMARSGYYRSRGPALSPPRAPQAARIVHRAMSLGEREAVREILNSDRFVDASPRTVYATLLDEGRYVCHWRTMYRVLADYAEVKERRDQLRHPAYTKPELMATGPLQLWSWDITKLRGPSKGYYFYLYVILDVFSRYAVGWLLADRESEGLARQLIAETYLKEGVEPGGLTLHADRGAPMTAKNVAQLLADLGVEPSHSRPHVSDDNPYSEAQFKTLKYAPAFPDRFNDLATARTHCQTFFPWYNTEHRHSGLAYLTPEVVHLGLGEDILAQRRTILAAAHAQHPERFVNGPPRVAELPKAVWINKPAANDLDSGPQPALQDPQTGAQSGSGAGTMPSSCPAQRTLDPDEHRATLALEPAPEMGVNLVLQ